MGICLILGLLTRIQAAIGIMMGLVTILVPGLIIMQDVASVYESNVVEGIRNGLLHGKLTQTLSKNAFKTPF